MSEIILPNRSGGIITSTATGSTFAALAAPAIPTFETLRELAPAFEELHELAPAFTNPALKAADWIRYTEGHFLDRKQPRQNRDAAWERLDWLPGGNALQRAEMLFTNAETKSAPPEWLQAIVDQML